MKSLEDRSQNKFQMKWKYKVRKSSPYSKVLSVSFDDVTEIRSGYELTKLDLDKKIPLTG